MGSIDQGEKQLNALGFRRAIVDAYFQKFRKSVTNNTLHPGNNLLQSPAENLQYDNCGHWIAKWAQRRCAIYGRKETSKKFCENYNDGLHADCLKTYHIP